MNAAQMDLGTKAAEAAMQAAAEYLVRHKLTADTDRLSKCLQANIRIRIPEALRDAKEALDAHMDGVAAVTFLASMRLAGIDAAKECGQ